MMRFKKISEAIDDSKEDDLKKIYFVRKNYAPIAGKLIKDGAIEKDDSIDAAAEYFEVIGKRNVVSKPGLFKKDMPILNCNGDDYILKEFEAGNIKEEDVFNFPGKDDVINKKEDFAEFLKDSPYLPKTVFTSAEALDELTFPIIGKPSDRNSGEGIVVFNNKEELEDIEEKDFQLFSEYIDKDKEFRLITFNGEIFSVTERHPKNDKAKTGAGVKEDYMLWGYELITDIDSLPEKYRTMVSEVFNKFKDKIIYICFDVMQAKDGKLYLAELNSHPGLPFDAPTKLYSLVFNYYYGRPVNSTASKKLKEYSEKAIDLTLSANKEIFSKRDKF